MTARTFSASLLLALSLAACGQSVSTPDAAPPGSQKAASACVELFESYAGWIKGCTGTRLAGDEIDHLAAGCAERAALPGIDATPAAIASCGARIAASSCVTLPADCILSNGPWSTPLTSRDLLFNEYEAGTQIFPRALGKLAAGTTCDVGAQCQSGACSTNFSFGYDYTCGICVDLKNTGDACDATSFCQYGSSCTDGACKDGGHPLGAACEAPKGDSNCQQALYCPSGTCVSRLHVGDTCGDGVDQWESCERGSVCNASTCKLIVQGPAGAACDGVVTFCDAGMFCAEGHCRVPVADVGIGGACVGDACVPGLRCKVNVCAAPAQSGEPCFEDRECGPGLICPVDLQQDPRCAPPSQEGEACVSSDACDGGLFCDGTIPAMPVCHRLRAAGDPCNDGNRCWSPLICIDSVCGELGVCSTP